MGRQIELRIGQPIIDCRQARRTRIREPCRLHRRWLARHHQRSAATHVHGEIDEDIDAIRSNQFRRLASLNLLTSRQWSDRRPQPIGDASG